MSRGGRIVGVAAGAAGVAAAGAAADIARRRRADRPPGHRRHARSAACGPRPITVIADDGVPLHVEVDELEQPPVTNGRRGRRKGREAPPLTIVFAHGFALNLDCWHFQRAAYRGLVRTVFYDQRSHGRSGRSGDDHATIDQLGHRPAVGPRRGRAGGAGRRWSATRWAA